MNTEETKELENNSINVNTYIEKCLETYELTNFKYHEETNLFENFIPTNSITILMDITPEEDKITFHVMTGLQIPQEKYREVLDYINYIHVTDDRYPRLYITTKGEDEYCFLDAEYILPVQPQMSTGVFVEILVAFMGILGDHAPNILRIILDIETEENE